MYDFEKGRESERLHDFLQIDAQVCSCSSISVMIYGIPDNALGWVICPWRVTRQPPQNRLAKNIL
jgi:hypothetical protein